MKRIVQCVPNFSEGKDWQKIEQIVAPLKNQEGFSLISYEADRDYNRTVVTLLGEPEKMLDALIAFMRKAVEMIDMNHQKGEHPRMGAIDVVPFIPIENVTMTECVDIAHALAERVAKELEIPVFTYAEAAKQNNRKKLPVIRKGEYEGMKEKLSDEAWHPDYGNPLPHETAGVTAIGARMPLIAYNIDLETEDIDIAKTIARAIRGSNGGFKHVQAGPVFLQERNHVQVTMNILDYKQNPLYRIFETVSMEAKRYHVKVSGSEIVGLVPKDTLMRSIKYYQSVDKEPYDETIGFDAVVKACEKYLKFRDFNPLKIIEANRG